MKPFKLYNPKVHHRCSHRLKHHDYASPGLYFITFNTQNRIRLFGSVKIPEGQSKPQMVLSEAGKIADSCWLGIPQHFQNVVLHEYVIMPDHIHGIIEIINPIASDSAQSLHHTQAKIISPSPVPSVPASIHTNQSPSSNSNRPKGTSKTIGSIVRGFKIGVTKWVRQNTQIHKVWQRDYHDRIIRSQKGYRHVSAYIKNNPKKWYWRKKLRRK